MWVGNGRAAQDLQVLCTLHYTLLGPVIQFLLGLGITAVVNMAEGDRWSPVLVDTELYNQHSQYTIFLKLSILGTGSLLILSLLQRSTTTAR